MLTLKARYSSIYTHLNKNGDAQYRRLREEGRQKMLEAFNRGGPLVAREISTLVAFPEIAYDLAPALLKAEDALEQLHRHPAVLFHALIGDYESASPHLEPYIIGEGEGESVFRLLCWAQRKQVRLRKPIEYYESWLARDPYWAGVYLAQNGSQQLAVHSAAFAERFHKEDAGAAYAYLRMHPESDPAQFAKIITSNPFYLLLAILNYPGHFSTKLTLRESLTPRWAYHLSLTTGCTDKSFMEDVMQDDLGWLLEYFVASGMATERANARQMSARFLAATKQAQHCCEQAGAAFINRLAAHFQAQAKSC